MRHRSLAISTISLVVLAMGQLAIAAMVTPAQWLQLQTKPVFKSGHTLPPLGQLYCGTQSGVPPTDTRSILALYFGYAVYFNSIVESNLISLCQSNPSVYQASASFSPHLENSVNATWPDGSWIKNANGQPLNGQYILSPQMPDAAWQKFIDEAKRQIQSQINTLPASSVKILQNWTENGLNLPSYYANIGADQDPVIAVAKGTKSWETYISERGSYYHGLLRTALKSAYPNAFYTAYTFSAGGGPGNWQDMKVATDLSSPECYFNYYNSGYKLSFGDMLSLRLWNHKTEISEGTPYYYGWLSAGFDRNITAFQGDVGQGMYSDLPRWMGYLKMSYTLGMLGGTTTGDFNCSMNFGTFDQNIPPKWLDQMPVLGHAHALFSWLEPMLRNSDLLPGPDSSYEFPTAFGKKSRVLVRKFTNADKWLICAWAMDSMERDVTVSIPVLGDYTILARPCGTVCLAGKLGGQTATLWYDENGMNPSLSASTIDTTVSTSNPKLIMIDRPSFSTPGGIYGSLQNITLTCSTPGTQIRYTLDGSDPTVTSTLYTGPISISNYASIKARAYKTNMPPSFAVSANYRILSSAPAGLVMNPGLTYKYYEGAWQNMPNFNTLTPKSQGTSTQMLLSQFSHANDSFAVVFAGYLHIPTDGFYTFSIMSDDGSTMYLDTFLMVNNDGVRTSMARAYGPMTWIKAGYYPVTFSYFFLNGLITYFIPEWEGPGLTFGRIPAEYLFTSTGIIGTIPQPGRSVATIKGPQIAFAKYAAGYLLTISTQGDHTVEIYTGAGRLVQSMNGKNRAYYTLDTHDLAQGIHIVRVRSQTATFSRTIVFE